MRNTSLANFIKCLIVLCFVLAVPVTARAATMSVAPGTGVYTIGSTFTVNVSVNTKGAAINAAEGTLSFNPSELSVVSVSKSSVFSLWTADPSFSNSAGTINFSGGTPSGYTGSNGTVLSVTFRAKAAATARVTISAGSVLAADGRGTNVLTAMNGGTFTISAASSAPQPEVIVEYVPPANTPAAPTVTSDTHDRDGWSREKTAVLSWRIPDDVTAVRTALTDSPSSIPTKVYDTPISTITITDLEEGEQYFHIQFQNKDGWGRVTHYPLRVDTQLPELALALPTDANLTRPNQVLFLTGTSTDGAPIARYTVRVGDSEPVTTTENAGLGVIKLPPLAPGYHTISVEVVDAAGNQTVLTTTLTIESFGAPTFSELPTTVNPGVIPVIKGETRPRVKVSVTLATPGQTDQVYEVTADGEGVFTLIPNARLPIGVYTVTAVATDEFGAQSAVSEPVRLLVEESGIIRFGSFIIDVMSIVVSLVALALLSLLLVVYSWRHGKQLFLRVGKEANEVGESVGVEFAHLKTIITKHRQSLIDGRKTKKLTTAEETLLSELESELVAAERRVRKEALDVTEIIDANT